MSTTPLPPGTPTRKLTSARSAGPSVLSQIISATTFFAALLGLWEYGSRALWWNPVLIPAPSDIGKYIVQAVADGELLSACWVTLKRLLLGYLIGIAIGIPLGLLTSRFKFANNTLGFVALGLQTLPSVC